MESNKKGNASLIAGALGGISVGWIMKSYLSKQQQLEEHRSIIQRVKDFESKLYEDGKKRANVMEDIKQEVHRKV
ncbi:hypothetical protein [Oceanobacillus rekensis]|uniref:hypothetical protein n=1 Tax=Oceanobacillus rekensis TaxID=937927 RepID=UPI000B44F03B|nr:hypothetical protein [Oceanobacillus rekensis]